MIKTSGRAALILAAGLLVLLAGPGLAATDGDDSTADAKADNSTAAPLLHRSYRHVWRHRRSYAHRRPHAVAKADADKDDDKKVVAANTGTRDNKAMPEIAPSIANANAQMLLAGVQLSAAAAIPTGADIPAKASDHQTSASADNETLMVAADQLNDVDRTVQEGSSTAAVPVSPPPPPAQASAPIPAPLPAATAASESSVWDQASLVGKIFIGFGALLTMASAARMFIT